MTPKQKIKMEASKKGLQAVYSGKASTMFIKGNQEAAKSFIRVCNLKGKKFYPFNISMS